VIVTIDIGRGERSPWKLAWRGNALARLLLRLSGVMRSCVSIVIAYVLRMTSNGSDCILDRPRWEGSPHLCYNGTEIISCWCVPMRLLEARTQIQIQITVFFFLGPYRRGVSCWLLDPLESLTMTFTRTNLSRMREIDCNWRSKSEVGARHATYVYREVKIWTLILE
jgi:hypothetical protein